MFVEGNYKRKRGKGGRKKKRSEGKGKREKYIKPKYFTPFTK
jgi:hypothetical protein